MQWDNNKWVLQQEQRVVARKPNEVQTIAHGGNEKIQWHVAEIFCVRARLGLKSIATLSFHLSRICAKRAVAGPTALQEAMDDAIHTCEKASRPRLDIVCGDINMARWTKGDSALWQDATYDLLETRGITPISDWRG